MKILKNLFSMSWALLKYPVLFVCTLAVIWFLVLLAFYVRGILKGRRMKKGQHRRVKESGLLKQVFYEAPRQYVEDMFDADPDFFRYQGLVLYTGMQGNGKTIAMVHDILQMQKEYPRCKCITNFAYKNEDDCLTDWHQLIDYKNDIYGVIVGMDEIQNWFSSKQSRDFPPQMFEVVTQSRKNRRTILASSQHFYLPAKDIRAQCTEVRKCVTLLGVFTIVHAVRPVFDGSGDVKDWKHVRWYSFVHNREIRESYDTYKVIESLAKSGFRERVDSGVDIHIHTGKR